MLFNDPRNYGKQVFVSVLVDRYQWTLELLYQVIILFVIPFWLNNPNSDIVHSGWGFRIKGNTNVQLRQKNLTNLMLI